MFAFNHFNFNVTDLNRSIAFYHDALGLEPVRRKEAADGSFILTFLGDGKTEFQLELTWLRDRTTPYDLGECEFHLAFRADDFDAAHAKHKEMGCICFEIRFGRVRIPLGSGGGGYGKGSRSPRKAGLHLLREPGHGYLLYL